MTIEKMDFDPEQYGPEVARILALDGAGRRLMPLARGRCSSAEAKSILDAARPADLFAGARAPEAAMAGLYLYFSCLDESHELSQSIHTAEGSYWHGIMHRQEPDPGNAGYWFRRVGRHASFPALRDAAVELGWPVKGEWDPYRFIDLCEPGGPQEDLALKIQRAEWQLLFDYCARRVK